jgi:hypothetical protein
LITIGSRVAETPPTIDKAIRKMNDRVADMFQVELAMLGTLGND